jgi:NADH-quinone oxidoreductase E subunit
MSACQQEIAQDKFAKLNQIIAENKGKKGALLQVLQQAQQIFGYVPMEVQKAVADGMDVPLSEVYGIVTFYSFFSLTPKGKYQINTCLGTACYVRGSGQVLERIEKELGAKVGENTKDGKFSISACRCVGACGLAPVIMINDDVYGRMTPDQVPEILKKYE